MDSTKHRFFAPCPRGLEGVLEQELRALGIPTTAAAAGGVSFQGPWSTMYWVNLWSHLASRVLWQVGQRAYRTEDDIYQAAYGLPWSDWFDSSHSIKVRVSAHRCPLPSLDFVTLRIKDAICDRFVALAGRRPSVDTNHPDIRVDAFIDSGTVTLYLDTSGEPLFKRGYRLKTIEAPLRENLAAGLLRLAGWTPEEVLMDPMCGTGTIPLEAALMARRIAPGFARSFAFERFRLHDAKRWAQLREAARAKQRNEIPVAIHASDHDAAAIKAAQRLFQGAGVALDVRLQQQDILSLGPPAPTGLLLMNPPYGVRLGKADELETFYPRLGDWLKQTFAGWRAYILTADPRLAKAIGLSPSRRIPLYNGALECRLYEFNIVRGGARRNLRYTSKR
ncbi:MAG TPA: THUMP domain-containing protein [Nitrospira sp.]|nr:THUMP domain-containing protein [Nitrospira sp.]